MTHEEIAENLLFPLWRCLSADFKQRYKGDAWGIFENFIRSAACCGTLIAFFDKFKRLAPMEWQHQYESKVISVLQSGQDETVLGAMRSECSYLILLTRVQNEAHKEKFATA